MATYSINVGVNAAQAARGIQQLRSSLRNLNNTADRSRNILSTLFVVPLFGIFTLQAAFVNIISTLAEYSSAMATVRAVSAATITETQQLNREFQRLGVTTKFTATEAANAGVFLSRAGFAPPQIAQIVEESLDLALATGVVPDRAADIATNVLTAFNLPIEKLGLVFDQLAFVANRTNTDLTQLAEALKFIGPAAESANIPLNEVISAIGILAQAGIRGSIAGTGLRRTISRLSSQAPIIGKKLAQLGLNFDEVAIGGGDLIRVFTILIENGVGLGEAFALFADRGGPAFEAIADRVPELIRLANETKEASGFVNQLVTIVETSLTFVLAQVKSAFEGVILAVGELIDVPLKLFLFEITNYIRTAAAEAELLVDILQTLALGLGAVFTLFLARIAVPLLGFFTGLTTVGRTLAPLIVAIFSPLGEGATRTRAILASVYVTLTAIFGVIKIAFGVGATLLAAFSDKIQFTFTNVVTLQDYLLSLGRAVVEQFTDLTNAAGEAGTVFDVLTDRLIAFVGSEEFARGLFTIIDIITRAAIIAKEAISLIFNPATLFGPIIATAQIELTKLSRAVLIPVVNTIDFISSLNPVGEDRPESFRDQLQRESDAEISRLTDDLVNQVVSSDQFVNIVEALRGPILDFEEILSNATNRAVTRSLDGYRDEIQLLADQPVQRLPLGPEPNRLTEDETRDRKFDIYLANLQKENNLLKLGNSEREFQTKLSMEISNTESALGFEILGIRRERLQAIIRENIALEDTNAFRDRIRLIDRENMLLQLNVREREILSEALKFEEGLKIGLTAIQHLNLIETLEENRALKEQEELYKNLRGAEQQRIVDRMTLSQAYAAGGITLREFNRELQDLEILEIQGRIDTGDGNFIDGFIVSLNNFSGSFTNIFSELGNVVGNFTSSAANRFADFIGASIFATEDLGESFKALGRAVITDFVSSLVKVGIQWAINAALGATLGAAATASSAAQAGTLAAAWAPAAALASLASYGGNAIPANVALLTTVGLAQSLASLSAVGGFQDGGFVFGPGTSRSDSILARLSNGEFVVNADATRRNRALLEDMNNGRSEGGRPIQVTYNISTPDVDSFKRSQGQILNSTETAIIRASRRIKQ